MGGGWPLPGCGQLVGQRLQAEDVRDLGGGGKADPTAEGGSRNLHTHTLSIPSSTPPPRAHTQGDGEFATNEDICNEGAARSVIGIDGGPPTAAELRGEAEAGDGVDGGAAGRGRVVEGRGGVDPSPPPALNATEPRKPFRGKGLGTSPPPPHSPTRGGRGGWSNSPPPQRPVAPWPGSDRSRWTSRSVTGAVPAGAAAEGGEG